MVSDELRRSCSSLLSGHVMACVVAVVCVLVRRAFEDRAHKLSETCCVILDSMISCKSGKIMCWVTLFIKCNALYMCCV